MSKKQFAFGRRNYKFMFIGIAIIAIGFLLMSGGGVMILMFLMKRYIILEG